MKKHTREKPILLPVLLLTVLCLAVLWLFVCAVRRVDDGSGELGRELLETAVRKTAATCYAAEGFYPPSLSYMEEHYGLQIDESRYLVSYDVFAENLMPSVTVREKNHD